MIVVDVSGEGVEVADFPLPRLRPELLVVARVVGCVYEDVEDAISAPDQ